MATETYKRLGTKFLSTGMDLNAKVDKMPLTKFAILKNVRSYQNGRIEPRVGVRAIGDTGVVCIPAQYTKGVFYSAFFTTTGLTPPLTFSVILGVLPPGLTLNSSTGEVSGVATASGYFPYTIKVEGS